MSSETDHPRQRTVAELLAEHGGSGATGRRRRRREVDGPEGPAATNGVDLATTAAEPNRRGAPPPVPDRAVLREPVPRDGAPDPRGYGADPVPDLPRPAAPLGRPADRSLEPPRGGDAPAPPPGPVARPPQGARRPIEAHRGLDPGLTGPIQHQRRDAPPSDAPRPVTDPGRSSVLLKPAPADAGIRTDRRHGADGGGPPTQAAPFGLDDGPAGLGTDEVDTSDPAPDAVATQRRLGRSAAAASSGPAWVVVVAQWIIGALGGAALWVGFRFLWRELPVVALAAAVLVTVGLVVVVRALLRNDDTRTTVFAVLVGLLLTVSPAILVLLGR